MSRGGRRPAMRDPDEPRVTDRLNNRIRSYPADHAETAATHLSFADDEVRGRSPLYESFLRGVAGEADVLAFLHTLPPPKRQPNLLLGAVRHLFGVAGDWSEFRNAILGNQSALRALMLARSTQTNEPGRCAVLLPVLARLPQPLALIEVGASAGLCLLPDRYAYDYGGHRLGRATHGPVFTCAANTATPLPNALPTVVWRAGLDLDPIDAADPAQTAWLEALVWPEQTERLARLRAAVTIAAADPPRIVKGDLRTNLSRLASEAPRDATLVIFHSAVLGYVAATNERDAFARTAAALARFWISNELPDVFPAIAARAPSPRPRGRFLLALNGRPLAWADPHGVAIDWIGEP
jgi:hypothetical protein